MTPWLKTTITLLIGFLLGIAATGLACHVFFPPHHPPGLADEGRILKRLDSKLSFTPDQREKVDSLLKQMLPQADTLRKATDTKFQTIWLSFRSQLRPLLNPDQVQKYNDMVAKWDQHQKEEQARTGSAPVSTEAVTGR